MKHKREKDYWRKATERFEDGASAMSRAGALRTHEDVGHVTVQKEEGKFVVTHAVARWYVDELHKAGANL